MEFNRSIDTPKIKLVTEESEIEFDVEFKNECLDNDVEVIYKRYNRTEPEIAEIDKNLDENNQKIDDLNIKIDRLTNQSDDLDNVVAVLSGVVAGLVDSLWVGEFSLDRGTEWGKEKVNRFVKKIAKSQGCRSNDLQRCICYLEKKYPLSSDSNTPDFGGGFYHHLNDFSHHSTIVGLIFSMLTQFTGKAYGTDQHGNFKIVEVRNKAFIGENLPKKFLYGFVFWFFHMVSDLAGSSCTPGAGMGLPGPLVSFAKQLATLPIFKNISINDKSLNLWISKLFTGTAFIERDENGKIIKDSVLRFDFRAELGFGYEVGRQAIPVLLNECIVRGFYFIRRFTSEIKDKNIYQLNDLKKIEWRKVLPWRNRTIVRMLTISSTTFTLIDVSDAAIRGAIKSGGNYAVFAKEFILRVNFVGIGRLTVALGTDLSMGVRRSKLRDERMKIFSEQLYLMNAKIYYKQANAWKAAEKTEESIQEVFVMVKNTTVIFAETWMANFQSMKNIGDYKIGIEEHNPDLKNEIFNILKN